MKHCMALLVGIFMCTAGLAQSLQAQSTPTGELVYAFHVTLSPSWFDPDKERSRSYDPPGDAQEG